MNILEQNRQMDLYLLDPSGHVVFIPQNWCDDFEDINAKDDGLSIYCWFGQDSVNNWLTRRSKEWLTYEAQGWLLVDDLEKMPQLAEEQARKHDPDLFRLLDAVNSGIAT